MTIIKILSIITALVAGTTIAFQSPINAKLGIHMGGPLVATFCSFTVGTIALGALMIATGNLPRFGEITNTSIWMWAGGLLGAVFVFTSISIVPILGAALMIALFVTGQLVGAIIIDKTGFLLPQSIDISWERLLALALVVAGVALFSRSS